MGLFLVGTPSPMVFMLRQSLSLLFILLVSGLSAWEAASVWEVHHTPEILFVMVLALFSALRPTRGIGFFLVILPIWGGHYASKPQMVFFLQLLGVLSQWPWVSLDPSPHKKSLDPKAPPSKPHRARDHPLCDHRLIKPREPSPG
ncbi:MAG: hypothetical protein EBQ73_05260 [Gammaproteobacteria bacterium]|nr:hypothetical protein [Gammaproteobacteria bacterium]